MITLNDIAKAGKCSVSTVSMALSDHPNISKKTKKDVIRISQKLGYKTPRERMRSRPSTAARRGLKRIGFFLIGDTRHHEVYPTIVHALATNTSSLGIRFEMASLDPAKADIACDKVLSFAKGVDGLIVTGYVEENLLETLGSDAIPHVLIGHYQKKMTIFSRVNANIVDYNYPAMGKLAIKYLANQGHSRIGFLCETLPKGLYYSRWLEGYRLGLADLDLPFEPAYVHVAGRDFAGGEPAAKAFSSQTKPPTAFLVPEVRTASSFIHAMEKLGKTIDGRNIVISSTSELIEKYGVGHYPLIVSSGEWVAIAAVRQLIQIFENPLPFTTELLVPFAVHNMPELDETNANTAQTPHEIPREGESH